MSSGPWQKWISSEAGNLGLASKGFLSERPSEKNCCDERLGHGVFAPDDWLLLQNTLGLSP